MPSWPIRDRRWEWDRRTFEERRHASDRRGRSDGSVSEDTDGTNPDGARKYAFRSFSDRRRRGERRTVQVADRRAHAISREDDGAVDLSAEEVRALFYQPED